MKLFREENVLCGSCGEEQRCRHRLRKCVALTNHRHQRHEARSCPDQQHGVCGRLWPKEMASQRTTKFYFVSDGCDVVEEGRHLTIGQKLNSDLYDRACVCR